jgi:protein-disulfide isomerase
MASSTAKIVGLFVVFIGVVSLTTFGLMKGSGSSQGVSTEQVQAIVRDYIQANPELILKSLTDYQQKAQAAHEEEVQKSVVDKKDDLENDPTSPVTGNKNGDVTLVQFLDYSCGYCKKVFPAISELLKEDPNLKVVYKEFPILGPNSLLAAQAALAVNMIDPAKYETVHNELMKGRIAGKDAILKIVGDAGVSVDEVAAKMDSPEIAAIIEKNKALASSIGVRGTPAFTINGDFVPGAIEYDDFKARIKAAREAKAKAPAAVAPAPAAAEPTPAETKGN